MGVSEYIRGRNRAEKKKNQTRHFILSFPLLPIFTANQTHFLVSVISFTQAVLLFFPESFFYPFLLYTNN